MPSATNLSGKKHQRGSAMLLFTCLIAFVVIPMVGFAVDFSIVFWAKAKLSSAVDAAALAAGRNINTNYTTAQNSGTVATIANQWFWANFPSGWMGTTVLNGGPTISYQTASYSTQQVNVSASVQVPLIFLQVIKYTNVTISASAQSSRRNSFIVLVLDRSGSMGNSWLGTNVCGTMQADAITFVDMFTESFDTMSLVTFSSTAGPSPDYGPTQTFKSGMASTINSLSCSGATSTAQALHVAYNDILNNGFAGGLNVIVLFTDGQPNEVVASYPVRTSSDTRYGIFSPSIKNAGYNWSPYNAYLTTNTYSIGASGCLGSSLSGGYTTMFFDSADLPPGVTGMTGGIFDTTDQVSVSSTPGYISTTGCWMNSSINGVALGPLAARWDIAYIPTSDSYGNKTNAGYGSNSAYYGSSVSSIATFSSGTYSGQIRPDEQTAGIMAAAINAADYQAQVIRNDTTYNPVIYTIGLGGANDMPVDSTLLERIANDTRSPIYDSTKTAGLYVYSPTSAQLQQAFTQVASQILRLSK